MTNALVSTQVTKEVFKDSLLERLEKFGLDKMKEGAEKKAYISTFVLAYFTATKDFSNHSVDPDDLDGIREEITKLFKYDDLDYGI